MKFEIVKLFYSEGWKKIQRYRSKKKSGECNFNWFLCSKRFLDSLTDLYYIRISVNSQFYSESTGMSLIPRGLYIQNDNKQNIIPPRLLILSDPHNKKKIIELGFHLKCDSSRDKLSTECTLTCDSDHLKKAAEFAVRLGYDGVAIKHDCSCKKSELSTPLCYQSTFVFKQNSLVSATDTDSQRCGMVKYSKKHNSKIREQIKKFPTCQEIDDLLKKHKCYEVSKILYSYMKEE